MLIDEKPVGIIRLRVLLHRLLQRVQERQEPPATIASDYALAEIDYEVDYYESRHVGLGAGLEDEIEAAFELVLRFPEAAPQWKLAAF